MEKRVKGLEGIDVMEEIKKQRTYVDNVTGSSMPTSGKGYSNKSILENKVMHTPHIIRRKTLFVISPIGLPTGKKMENTCQKTWSHRQNYAPIYFMHMLNSIQ